MGLAFVGFSILVFSIIEGEFTPFSIICFKYYFPAIAMGLFWGAFKTQILGFLAFLLVFSVLLFIAYLIDKHVCENLFTTIPKKDRKLYRELCKMNFGSKRQREKAAYNITRQQQQQLMDEWRKRSKH